MVRSAFDQLRQNISQIRAGFHWRAYRYYSPLSTGKEGALEARAPRVVFGVVHFVSQPNGILTLRVCRYWRNALASSGGRCAQRLDRRERSVALAQLVASARARLSTSEARFAWLMWEICAPPLFLRWSAGAWHRSEGWGHTQPSLGLLFKGCRALDARRVSLNTEFCILLVYYIVRTSIYLLYCIIQNEVCTSTPLS